MDKAHTEAAHQKGPFPPFQKENFASQLVWLVMSFVVLYALLWKLVLPRVASILAARRARIESDLAQAARAKAESEAALARYEKSLADARANVQATAAMKNVRGIAVDAASAIVERITGAAPAKPAVERAVDQAIN